MCVRMKKSQDKKNLISGILICISCGSDRTTRDRYLLQCRNCNYINFYEAA